MVAPWGQLTRDRKLHRTCVRFRLARPVTESLREMLQFEAQRIAECCMADTGVAPEAVYGFLEASGWRQDLVTGGDYGWTHPGTRTTAGHVTEALAESLARYRESANGWPAFCADCWRR